MGEWCTECDPTHNMKHHVCPAYRLSHMEAVATEINLSQNMLAVFPSFISQFRLIGYLNLSGNRFADLPPQIGLLTTLRELNIANNR